MRFFSKSAVRNRFFLLYLIFALVLFAMYIPLHLHTYSIISENVRSRIQRNLERGIQAMESSIRAVSNTYNSTIQDARFRPLIYQDQAHVESPSDLRNLVDALTTPFTSDDLVGDVGILCGNSLILSRNRSFYSETYYSFYPDFLQCGEMTFSEWKEWLLSANRSGTWLPEATYTSMDYSSPYAAITYARIWPSTMGASQNVYYATLRIDKLMNMLADEAILSGGYLRITDVNGNVLLQQGAMEYGNASCEALRAVSSQTGISVELGIPKAYLHAQMAPLEKMLALYIIAFVAVAIAMVVIFSHRSAAPMQKILHSLQESHFPVPDEETRENAKKRGLFRQLEQDYGVVASSISYLDRQLSSHAEMVKEQKLQLRNQLFDKALLYGLYAAKDCGDFAQFFPDFPSAYRLALLKVDWRENSVDRMAQAHYAMLHAAQTEIPDIYYTHTLSSGSILLVLPEAETERRESLEQIRAQLQRACDLPITCILSQSFARANDLAEAYRQLQYFDFIPSTASVITPADLSEAQMEHTVLPLSLSQLLEMYNALSTGDEALARIILSEAAETILSHPDRILLGRHTHSMIGHMLAQIKLEYPAELFRVVVPALDTSNLEHLYRVELPECFHQICQTLLDSRTPDNDLPAAVLRFIHENLFSVDMCTTFVADHFGISKPNLQKILKNATGVTFSVFVSTQRMDRAYQLMQEPGVSVQKVAELCGFSSPNSFYKAFRRKYGVAPSAIVPGVPAVQEGAPEADEDEAES